MKSPKTLAMILALAGLAGTVGIGSAYDFDSKLCGTAWLQLFECNNGTMAWALHQPGYIVSWKSGTTYSSLVPPVDVMCTWTATGVDCNGNTINRTSTDFVSTQYPVNNCSQ